MSLRGNNHVVFCSDSTENICATQIAMINLLITIKINWFKITATALWRLLFNINDKHKNRWSHTISVPNITLYVNLRISIILPERSINISIAIVKVWTTYSKIQTVLFAPRDLNITWKYCDGIGSSNHPPWNTGTYLFNILSIWLLFAKDAWSEGITLFTRRVNDELICRAERVTWEQDMRKTNVIFSIVGQATWVLWSLDY